jgi:hypothetical protein
MQFLAVLFKFFDKNLIEKLTFVNSKLQQMNKEELIKYFEYFSN